MGELLPLTLKVSLQCLQNLVLFVLGQPLDSMLDHILLASFPGHSYRQERISRSPARVTSIGARGAGGILELY